MPSFADCTTSWNRSDWQRSSMSGQRTRGRCQVYGLGLSLCWRTIDVTFANARLNPLDGDGGLPVGADCWWLHDLDPGENYVGAVAVRCSNSMRVRCLDAPLQSGDG